jgi:SSS family solute:Na+ symporter
MVTGVIAFFMIAKAMGGLQDATGLVKEHSPQHLAREGMIGKAQFLTYMFVPLSVGMFPHLFQHWLTARSAKSFRLTVVFHPLCIAVVWVPCILIGIWAAGSPAINLPAAKANAVIGVMVKTLVESPFLSGLLTAGILAAIMSSLDSQFMCIGTMFTNDIVARLMPVESLTDRQKLWVGRAFVVAIVLVTYLFSLSNPRKVFELGVWCFSGFGSLFPMVFASVYWKRSTKFGAIACVITTATVWFLLFARADFGAAAEHDSLVWGMMPVAIIFAASCIAMVLGSLVSRPPSETVLKKFFPVFPSK